MGTVSEVPPPLSTSLPVVTSMIHSSLGSFSDAEEREAFSFQSTTLFGDRIWWLSFKKVA